ncbi:hypothetical protein HPB52_003472 [Rhipicephalus sanguineus]|uniref:Tick transposon n=1 Tax=Rhipicephalus sanguineus TaxID=34632 RepID=A0A9D4T5A3_RHISA|nr:hypothetical protein HPB52_003472 [Rhipicephalus sanguineus]
MDKFDCHGGLVYDEMKLSENINVKVSGELTGFVDLGPFTDGSTNTARGIDRSGTSLASKRRIFALPRTSRVGPTLAETNQLPLSLRAKAGALRHIHRMHQTLQGQHGHQATLSPQLPHALEYAALVPEMPHCDWLPIPPHRDRGLAISTIVPGVRCKKRTPQCALQETAAVIDEHLSGRVLVYTDGSVTAEGSAAAACVAPTLEVTGKCRLPFAASSTTAELAALDLADDILVEFLPPAAAVLCDSRAGLLALARGERGALIAQRLFRKFTVIQNSGCDLVFHSIGEPSACTSEDWPQQTGASVSPPSTHRMQPHR